jgi:Ser/Thr protein kinase RdoA (MazF antagonist)
MGYKNMGSHSSATDIQFAADAAELTSYTGNFEPLGGGEGNDTYLLDCGDTTTVLRIARHEGQQTLKNEANALRLLGGVHTIPALIHYDDASLINGRHWIMEGHLPGSISVRLTPTQFGNLGSLLAQVHEHQKPEMLGVSAWGQFLDNCESFGDEAALLNHPDPVLNGLIKKGYAYFVDFQPKLELVVPSLIHSDVTPSNILVNGDAVGLIDWEFANFSDPMAEFSTVYYEDMEYNNGKWRIQITDAERSALFDGYRAGGGTLDQDRISFWMTHDKLGAAVFLYWRIYQSGHPATEQQIQQYKFDLAELQVSLVKVLR